MYIIPGTATPRITYNIVPLNESIGNKEGASSTKVNTNNTIMVRSKHLCQQKPKIKIKIDSLI